MLNSQPTKILLILPSLRAGGAERILSFLAEQFDKDKFLTTLVVVGKESEAVFPVENTKIIFLNKNRVLNGIPSLMRFILKSKPDIVLSSIGHLNTVFGLLAPFFPKTKFAIREASVVSIMNKYSDTSKIYGILSKRAYKNIDSVICQSQDMASDFRNMYGVPDSKITVINNPITELFPLKNKAASKKITKYITVGRLSKEKGHDRLLNVLAKVSHPFHYTLIGSGPEENEIIKKIDSTGLTGKITLIPFSNQIGKMLSEHDIFLQGSYVEGFPNAVLESCVVGTPVVAFVAPGGTKEIIKEGINGFIVDNEEDFGKKLAEINSFDWNPQLIRDSVISKFDKQIILKQYEELILNL